MFFLRGRGLGDPSERFASGDTDFEGIGKNSLDLCLGDAGLGEKNLGNFLGFNLEEVIGGVERSDREKFFIVEGLVGIEVELAEGVFGIFEEDFLEKHPPAEAE